MILLKPPIFRILICVTQESRDLKKTVGSGGAWRCELEAHTCAHINDSLQPLSGFHRAISQEKLERTQIKPSDCITQHSGAHRFSLF